MNVLILGSGGREHALAWKIAQSKQLNKLYIAPGNAGTAIEGENVNINVNDFEGIKSFVMEKNIDLLVVGPEDPLVNGITDFFKSKEELKNVLIIGPDKAGAILEGSKEFAKSFMQKYNIPTAGYSAFTKETLEDAYLFLEKMESPYVLKADGLAAGKGVLIIDNLSEAKDSLREMLNGKFGKAGSTVVIEQFLSGIELSVFVLTDGINYKILPEAKDYKRIGENDTGLNTGGMGAVSPVPFANKDFMQKVEDEIIKPTINGLQKENIDYRGFIFFGLINVEGSPYVIEYNVRMGDPESEVVIPRIKSDLLDLLISAGKQNIIETDIEFEEETVSTVMLVSGGYPEKYEKGKEILGLDKIKDSIIFHAGTKETEGKVVTNGGRVIAVSSKGQNISQALEKSYKNAGLIDFDGKYYRKDIGFDL